MSPILVRPVREQLEHDRIIRLLHGKSRRRYDAAMNPGVEQNAPVGAGTTAVFPDLVLYSAEKGRRLEVVVEVETGESVNHLEALAQWAHFARLRAAFHLYVPSNMVEVAKQLCDDNHIPVTEVWSYHALGDDVRLTLIQRSNVAPVLAPVARRATPAADAPAKAKSPVKAAKSVEPVAKKKAAPPAAKRPAAKREQAKRPEAKKRPAARPVKTAPRRKVAPARKQAARPVKRK